LSNVPATLAVSTALGVWLMAAPAVLRVDGAAANSNYVAGALVITWSVIAFGEVARPVRLLNIPIAISVGVSLWLFPVRPDASRFADLLVAILLIPLSIPRGRIDTSFGGWNRYLV
jgi:hypothetical protein